MKVRDLRGDSSRPRANCPCRSRAAALGLAVWALAGAAVAADLPKVATVPFVLGPGASAAERSKLAALLADELSLRDTELAVVQAPAAAKAPAPSGNRAEGMRLLSQGKRLAGDGDFPQAASTLRRGVGILLSDPATAPIDDVVDALLTVAVAELRAGNEKPARSAMDKVVRLAPWMKLRGNKYPPVFTREFDKARARVLKGGMGNLVIEGPEGAKAFIDGRPAGAVPARVNALPHGDHYVRIELADGRKAGQEVEVGGKERTVTLGFTPPPTGAPELARPVIGEAELTALGTYAKAIGADWLLVGALADEADGVRVSGALYQAASGALIALPDGRFKSDFTGANVAALNLVDAVVARLGAPGTTAAVPFDLLGKKPELAVDRPNLDPVVVHPLPPPSYTPSAGAAVAQGGPSMFAKVPWWVWAAGATVVVAGATTAGVLYVNRPVTGSVSATW